MARLGGRPIATSWTQHANWWNSADAHSLQNIETEEAEMARAGLLWLLGIPIPILLLMWVLGWLH